jgi:glycosyltransferase involved in cell wall biosynthesis
MKIRLLQVLWEGIGGIERIVLDLTRHLDLEDYEITVAILKRGGCVTDSIDRKNISVVEFGARSGKDIAAMRSFHSFLRSGHFDIVHCHERSFLANLALVGLHPRPALIYHEHGGHLLFSNIKTRLTYAAFARFYNALIATHQEMVPYITQGSRTSRNKIIVIENAVDVDYFTPSAEGKSIAPGGVGVKTIGTVARLSPEKDFNLFYDIARSIIRKREDINFVIAGDGGMRLALQTSAAAPELGGRIKLIGPRSDVPAIMRTFDLFLFTSKVEAFGLTVLESLACGVPVVAAQPELGAAAKIFEKLPGVSLVRNRDPQALADECLNILKDPENTNTARKAGRDYVTMHYGLKNYVRTLDELYRRLFNSCQPGRRGPAA